MALTEGRSGAPELSSWTRTTPDRGFGLRAPGPGLRALLALTGAAGLLLAAWMTLDRSPLGAPAAALASSFVLVLMWAQFIRSEHDVERRHEADTILALGRLLGSMRPECTRRDLFSAAVRELLALTGARDLVAALEHRGTGRLLLIRMSIDAPGVAIQVRRVPTRTAGRLLCRRAWDMERIPRRARLPSLLGLPVHRPRLLGWAACSFSTRRSRCRRPAGVRDAGAAMRVGALRRA